MIISVLCSISLNLLCHVQSYAGSMLLSEMADGKEGHVGLWDLGKKGAKIMYNFTYGICIKLWDGEHRTM